MLFPQIRTHGVLQDGATRRMEILRSSNHLHDGSSLRGARIRPLIRSWQLSYVGLTAEESGRLRQLIAESRDAASGFTFIDPWSNMLGYSEDLSAEVWQASAFSEVIRVNPGLPEDAIHSIRSLSSGLEGIEQMVMLGGTGVFCLSCEVRSAAGGAGRIALQGASQVAEAGFTTGPAWRLVWVIGEFSQPVEELRAVIEVGPGEAVLVRGVELDYQGSPSPYKPSYGPGGIFPGARVVEEEYVQTVRGQDWVDCQIEVRVD